MSHEFKILLTGTPIQNNIQELWALLNFIMPQIFDDLSIFLYYSEEIIGYDTSKTFRRKSQIQNQNKQMDSSELYQKTEEFIRKIHLFISTFIMCRKKDDIMIDLPPKVEIILSCSMTPLQIEKLIH